MSRTLDFLRAGILQSDDPKARQTMCLALARQTNKLEYLEIVALFARPESHARRLAISKILALDILEVNTWNPPQLSLLAKVSVQDLRTRMREGDRSAAEELIDRVFKLSDLRYMADNFPDSHTAVLAILEHIASTVEEYIYIMKTDSKRCSHLWPKLRSVATREDLLMLRGELSELNQRIARELDLRNRREMTTQNPASNS